MERASRFIARWKCHSRIHKRSLLDSFEKELKRIYTDFDTYPSDVRLALFDLVFNLGMTKLKNNWPNFNKAIKAEDWGKAASNSNRKSRISDERNKYVKDLLEKSAKEKKRKVVNKVLKNIYNSELKSRLKLMCVTSLAAFIVSCTSSPQQSDLKHTAQWSSGYEMTDLLAESFTISQLSDL